MNRIENMYKQLEQGHRHHPVLAETGTNHPVNTVVAMLQYALDKSELRHVQSPGGRQLELTNVNFTFNVAAVHQEGAALRFSVLGAAGSAGASHRTDDTHCIQITLISESDGTPEQPHPHLTDSATNEFIPALQELHQLLADHRRSTAATEATVDLNFTIDEDLKVRIIAVGEALKTTTHGVRLTFKPGTPQNRSSVPTEAPPA